MRTDHMPSDSEERNRAARLMTLVVARAFDVPRESLMAKSRSRANIAFARQVAMYLMHVVFGQSLKDVGEAFGRERTTVAYACSLVEDERDDLAFDQKLDTLEDMLGRLWAIERLRMNSLKKSERQDQVAA
ncbi:MAG: helix-turn-helix domain-containing protein [Pseudomonadota bacterium]